MALPGESKSQVAFMYATESTLMYRQTTEPWRKKGAGIERVTGREIS